jgi:predicted Zn-dependent protease
MKGFKVLFFLFLLLGISGMIALFMHEKVQPPFARSLAPLYMELGKPIKSVDRVISKIYPINEIDEKLLGDELKLQFVETINSYSPEEKKRVRYLNSLVTSLTQESSKPFEYTVFLIEGPPNAFAGPGGFICITQQLMNLLQSEAELTAILGHEIGHIERGHLFDSFRDEMLRKKIQETSLPTYAAEVIQTLLHPTFSKTQENEADEYGFRLLLKKGYDPYAMSTAFEKLIGEKGSPSQTTTSPFTDFFSSHPHSEYRMDKFRSYAQKWKERHPYARSYRGKQNLINQITFFERAYSDEWIKE